jgi:hypothetical protein
MQDLQKGITQQIEDNTTPLSAVSANRIYPEFQKVAEDWATASLRTYNGKVAHYPFCDRHVQVNIIQGSARKDVFDQFGQMFQDALKQTIQASQS